MKKVINYVYLLKSNRTRGHFAHASSPYMALGSATFDWGSAREFHSERQELKVMVNHFTSVSIKSLTLPGYIHNILLINSNTIT